jgi:hypothetical protein
MDDKLCFVQFIHPAGEHEPDDGLHKGWNTNVHKRKFLNRVGRLVSNGKVEQSELLFWGEWEPESEAQRIEAPVARGPRFIYEPYYVVPKFYSGLQNTDPFVFGQQFHYTGCQQRTARGATRLRYLSKGSVILFGSCQNRNAFVLDTVFVVDHWIDHDRANYRKVLAGEVSQEYKEVTISPWYQDPLIGGRSCAPASPRETWRLYFGVTRDKPLHGMYSFFPCQTVEAKSKGFARPKISLLGVITDNLNQGKKLTERQSLGEMKLLWDKVAEQVEQQGLALGVYAEMPQRHLTDKSAAIGSERTRAVAPQPPRCSSS